MRKARVLPDPVGRRPTGGGVGEGGGDLRIVGAEPRASIGSDTPRRRMSEGEGVVCPTHHQNFTGLPLEERALGRLLQHNGTNMGPIGKKSEDPETIKRAPPMVSWIKIEFNDGGLQRKGGLG